MTRPIARYAAHTFSRFHHHTLLRNSSLISVFFCPDATNKGLFPLQALQPQAPNLEFCADRFEAQSGRPGAFLHHCRIPRDRRECPEQVMQARRRKRRDAAPSSIPARHAMTCPWILDFAQSNSQKCVRSRDQKCACRPSKSGVILQIRPAKLGLHGLLYEAEPAVIALQLRVDSVQPDSIPGYSAGCGRSLSQGNV